jgi:hypothetical protein
MGEVGKLIAGTDQRDKAISSRHSPSFSFYLSLFASPCPDTFMSACVLLVSPSPTQRPG